MRSKQEGEHCSWVQDFRRSTTNQREHGGVAEGQKENYDNRAKPSPIRSAMRWKINAWVKHRPYQTAEEKAFIKFGSFESERHWEKLNRGRVVFFDQTSCTSSCVVGVACFSPHLRWWVWGVRFIDNSKIEANHFSLTTYIKNFLVRCAVNQLDLSSCRSWRVLSQLPEKNSCLWLSPDSEYEENTFFRCVQPILP